MDSVKTFFGRQLFAVDGFKFTVFTVVVLALVVYWLAKRAK